MSERVDTNVRSCAGSGFRPGEDRTEAPPRAGTRPGSRPVADRTEAPGRPSAGRRIAARVPALLRDRAFRRYWSGQTISMFGDQISTIALPLVAVLTLHGTPAQLGILAALIWVPSLLFGLHAGAWVDRRGRRRAMMITADLGRAVLLASIPAGYALGMLTLWQLYVVAFGTGVFSVLFTVAQPALFVALVPGDRYVEGNSLIYGSRALSFVGGPSVGGVLVQLLTAPIAVVADALSFLGSAFFLSRIHPAEAPADTAEAGALTAGAKFIRGSAIVRSSLIAVAIINFFNFVFFALFLLYATRSLHVRPGLLGLVLGSGAVGGVLGALATKPLAARLGVGRLYTASCLVFTAPVVLVPLAGGPKPVILAMLFAAEFLSGFGVMTLDISIGSIFAAVIPDRLRSRVTGAFQAVNYGTRPLGALVGGALGTFIGLRPTLWIAAIGGMTGFLFLLPSPLPRFRMPAVADADPGSDSARDGIGPPDIR
jgi:MFS family permease